MVSHSIPEHNPAFSQTQSEKTKIVALSGEFYIPFKDKLESFLSVSKNQSNMSEKRKHSMYLSSCVGAYIHPRFCSVEPEDPGSPLGIVCQHNWDSPI